MEEVVVVVVVYSSIGEEAEGKKVLKFLSLADHCILLNQLNDVDLGRDVGALHSLTQVEVPNELLKNNVVL